MEVEKGEAAVYVQGMMMTMMVIQYSSLTIPVLSICGRQHGPTNDGGVFVLSGATGYEA
jgi:hypothetical protein